ncbi:MAG: DUF2163 domain-containing protein [Pseudomonadota bacterium]
MRDIPEGMQAKLDAGATTLCTCWQVNRRDLPPLGFTDHDGDLSFDDVLFEASSGIAASALEQSLGLSIDNISASGALQSARISEDEIARGRFDGAQVQQWLVDWQNPEDRILMFSGEIGEIRRGKAGFEVELRGVAERLNRSVGRHYLPVCDAELGDARCGVDTTDPAFSATCTVLSVPNARTLMCDGLSGFNADWFSFGTITWSDGITAGQVYGIKSHRVVGTEVEIELDRDLVDPVEAGASFKAIAGCDRRLACCREKFGNTLNFRGFPYIPGESWMAAYPVDGEAHDGGSRSGS